jgi:mannose-6-phosphate isomerase-like protein (cupin superfamily)
MIARTGAENMKRRTRFFVAAFFVCFSATSSRVPAAGQRGAGKTTWDVRTNETRGPVRAADPRPPTSGASSEILAGPTNGSDYGYLIFTRMPSGAHGPSLFTLPDEHLYLVVEGRMNIQIGADRFTVNQYEGVWLPAGIPHEVWNADAGGEAHFEVIAPGSSRDLVSMLKPAQARTVENAAQYIRRPKVPDQTELKSGLNGATFAARVSGGTIQMRIDSTLPGQGGPKPHVHKFQQVYFSIEGQTAVEYGLNDFALPKYSIAIIQPGVVHTNSNKTSSVERHITVLMPQLEDPNEPLDVEYERKGPVR